MNTEEAISANAPRAVEADARHRAWLNFGEGRHALKLPLRPIRAGYPASERTTQREACPVVGNTNREWFFQSGLTMRKQTRIVRTCNLLQINSARRQKPKGCHLPFLGRRLHTGGGLFIRVTSMKTPEIPHSFKGVWIRASLWRNASLTWFQKCLLAEIDNLQDGCFASNAYLAKIMCVPEKTLKNNLTALRKLGLILDWGFDGRRRQISVADSVSSDPVNSPAIGTAAIPQTGTIDTSVVPSESKEAKESTADAVAPLWKPDSRSKEEKLRSLKTPKDIPGELEFNEFVERESLCFVANVDIYERLSECKWRQWDGRNWRRIKYWQAYVSALNSKMEEATKNQ